MSNDESIHLVPANDVARFRKMTGMPWMECKRYLASVSPAEREYLFAAAESQQTSYLHDPIEDDPFIRPLYLAIAEEAAREVNEWHRNRIATMERDHPAIADVFRSGLGLCHRIWARIKELMLERHGIKWRSPREMNPGTLFD